MSLNTKTQNRSTEKPSVPDGPGERSEPVRPRQPDRDVYLAGLATARLAVDAVFARRRSYRPMGAALRQFWYRRVRGLVERGIELIILSDKQRRVVIDCPPYDLPVSTGWKPRPPCRRWFCPFCRARAVRLDGERFWATAKADRRLKIVSRARQTPFRAAYGPTMALPRLSVAGMLEPRVPLVAGAAYRRVVCRFADDGKTQWAVRDTAIALVRFEDWPATKADELREATRPVVISTVATAAQFHSWLFHLEVDQAATAVVGWREVHTSVRVGAIRAKYGSRVRRNDLSADGEV